VTSECENHERWRRWRRSAPALNTLNGSWRSPRCVSGRGIMTPAPGRSRPPHQSFHQESLSGFRAGAQRRLRCQRSWFRFTSLSKRVDAGLSDSSDAQGIPVQRPANLADSW